MSEDSSKKPNEKHLDFIEATITRMAQNSFHAKSWCITVVVALFAFNLTQQHDVQTKCACVVSDTAPVVAPDIVSAVAYVFISLAAVFLFAWIDTYYLCLERGFRGLYSRVARLSENTDAVKDYDMAIPKSTTNAKNLWSAFKSPSVVWFYLPLAVLNLLLLAVALILIFIRK